MIKEISIKPKSTTFLNLLKKFKTSELVYSSATPTTTNTITFINFKKYSLSLLNIIYISKFVKSNLHLCTVEESSIIKKNLFYYYAKLVKLNQSLGLYNLPIDVFNSYHNNNILVFSKPHKQLFLVFFKNKPLFIFTTGLMRIVMNEKRKSGKKLYKVAISLIKLAIIIFHKKQYFESCYVKLIQVGYLRSKIVHSLSKSPVSHKIAYIIFKLRKDITSQKLKTRRSIKKYVKKRFNLNN